MRKAFLEFRGRLLRLPRPVRVALAVGLLALAAGLSFPQAFGIVRVAGLTPVADTGRSAVADLPDGFRKLPKRVLLPPDTPRIFEDGTPLGRPGALRKEIQRGGYGRYRVTAKQAEFSASDPTAPASNGRRYEIRGSAFRVAEPVLLVLWAAGFVALALAVVGIGEFSLGFPAAGGILLAGFVLGGLAGGGGFAYGFQYGIWLPALWAAGTGWVAVVPGRLSLAYVLALCAVPVWAAWIYYGPLVGSHDSMAVAGSLPFSDAALHARQALELAHAGTTSEGFNGRFLYPAYFAQFLLLSGGDLSLANFLAGWVAVAACALVVRVAGPWTGRAGAGVFLLVCWLYAREFVAGLVMTEVLGLALGAVGTGFLLVGAREQSPARMALAVFFFALGMSARPGALFVLPALVLASGCACAWAVPRAPGSFKRALLAMVLAATALLAGFSGNALAQKFVFRGKVAAFQNFAFTFYGLMDGSTWGEAMAETGGDPSRAMREAVTMLRDSPVRLVSGTARAWGEMFGEAKLFDFGSERWTAGPLLALALAGFAAVFFWRPLRGHVWWAAFFVAGLLASIPFAPPWDAGIRPYAVTIPVQALFAGFGTAFLVRALAWVAGEASRVPEGPVPGRGALKVMGILLVILSLGLPALRSALGWRVRLDAPDGTVRGTARVVGPGGVPRAAFLERLSDFEVGYSDAARPFAEFPGGRISMEAGSMGTRFEPGP